MVVGASQLKEMLDLPSSPMKKSIIEFSALHSCLPTGESDVSRNGFTYHSSSQLNYRDQHSSLGMHGSMKNLGGGGQAEDELGDETSAFLGTPNSLGTGFPERGILKKFAEEDGSQSDNNEGLCDVERTLKSLNGYHEDILAALRIAAAQNRGLGDINSTPPSQSNSNRLNLVKPGGLNQTQGLETFGDPIKYLVSNSFNLL